MSNLPSEPEFEQAYKGMLSTTRETPIELPQSKS